jgi:hypothetical protein
MSRRGSALSLSTADDPSATSPEQRWEDLFGTPAPSRMPSFLEQAVAWREQVLAHGDVAPAIARDLRIVANHALTRRIGRGASDVSMAEPGDDTAALKVDGMQETERTSRQVGASRPNSRGGAPALPPASSQLLPGTRLVKAYGDRNHVVEVEKNGFRYEGERFTSLSAVAKHITGTHWNGLLFFGLRKRRTYPAKARARG